MTQADDPREPPSLGEIVREKTNDGLSILDFYIDAFEGELDGSTALTVSKPRKTCWT